MVRRLSEAWLLLDEIRYLRIPESDVVVIQFHVIHCYYVFLQLMFKPLAAEQVFEYFLD